MATQVQPNERALVVEDDRLLQDALAVRCARLGLEAVRAHDRPEALRLAGECALAIVDLGLPPTPHLPDEGLLLIESLVAFLPYLPVLVLTGQDEARSAHEAIARGAFDFLAKPVEGVLLDAAVTRALRFARTYRTLARQGRSPLQITSREVAQGLRVASDVAQEKLLRLTLASCGGNVSEAARILGLERTRLYYYLDKFGLLPKDKDR